MQFEELLPESQEIIKEFKIFANILSKNIDNILFHKEDFPIEFSNIPYKITNNGSIQRNFYQRCEHCFNFESFVRNLVAAKFLFDSKFDQIYSEVRQFLFEKKYFIKIPENKKFVCNSNYFIAAKE